MRPSEKGIFFDFLHEIADYYDKKLTAVTVEIYWDDLKYFTIPELKTAFSEYRKLSGKGKYMPKICEIIDLIPKSQQKKPEFICKHAGCQQESQVGGFCFPHYENLRPMSILEEKIGSKFSNLPKTSTGVGQIH
ncbi:MAG TPA: hypothetical protein VHZ76_00845 [Gammaproteobacteria bacterium]|jgi:hypothetical protein|nr:hypothetical protein [Gammaproteobacteria bacterium]